VFYPPSYQPYKPLGANAPSRGTPPTISSLQALVTPDQQQVQKLESGVCQKN
jgi:hypothetical protein